MTEDKLKARIDKLTPEIVEEESDQPSAQTTLRL